ncbi:MULTISPECIES: TraM recognition domain-containing protein [unclassified Streptomyces]|uniref:type IV secretory system conjugative DNA transfer family protein n=1 Tax=unclassified Streptomyces TaxID=2593676 RepID=UPI0033E6E950
MSATNKRRGPGPDISNYLLIGACSLVFVGVGVAWTSAALGARLTGSKAPGPNPFQLLFDLASGTYAWPGPWSTGVAAAELLLLAVLAALVVRAVRKKRTVSQPIDAAAPYMGHGKALAKISKEGATTTARRLGVPEGGSIGVFLGYSVIGRQPLYGSVEDTHLALWGTRAGKTTELAIPAVMDHGPAPLLATSNRRDLVDATRLPRSTIGTVWVFDVQDIIGEKASWYWNPLSYVTDITTAEKLADHFASDSRPNNASRDAYFDGAGEELLASYLLAAALDNQPITQVYKWLTDDADDEPARILEGAGPQYVMAAHGVRGFLNTTERQRSGIYGTAQKMASCLRNPGAMHWVTPPAAGDLDKRREFSPEDFVRSTDSLYLISREGKGSAGALVTALSVAVCEAAEHYAMRSAHGRLPRPLLAVLDEAANICRWSDLPNIYSHYGSRGIQLITILQSWDQGAETWGDKGMSKLWATANITSYGGGGKDVTFFDKLTKLVGNFEPETRSVSVQPNREGLFASNRSTSTSTRPEEIISVSDLTDLAPRRAVLFASQTRTTLIETVPWWEREWADQVQASFAMHDPGAST